MPNLIYQNEGTALIWADSGQTYALTFKGLAATPAGRQGATHDFGVDARATRFHWLCMVHFDTATTPTLDDRVDIYLKEGDGTRWANDDGEGDIAVSSVNKLKNLRYLGSIVVDEAVPDVPMVAQGVITIGAREIAPVIWNAADTLDDDASPTNSRFVLTPIPLEVQ